MPCIMTKAQVKNAWQTWQDTHTEEATRIRARFATKAIEHGLVKAERYLVAAIMERLHCGALEVQNALREGMPRR